VTIVSFKGSKANYYEIYGAQFHLRAFTMVGGNFGSLVNFITATSAYEPNFRHTSFTPCNARLTTLAHQIK